MSEGGSQSSTDWIDVILAEADPAVVWQTVFGRLRDISLNASRLGQLDKATVLPDRLLAESAWTLWDSFPQVAPSATGELKRFWVSSGAAGTAVLLLDGLSLRELHTLVREAKSRDISPTRIEAFASESPSETNTFASALGLPSRSSLANNKAPASFIFAGDDTHSDVLNAPFADCLSLIPSTPRVFVWHVWPDFPLIDENGKKLQDAAEVASRETKKQFSSDDFWSLIDRLRQGRRLVVTSDHGYALRQYFSSEVEDAESVKLLRETFGARRSAPEHPEKPWPSRHLPPLVCRHNGHLVVTGQRWWAVQGGFPYAFHGGLSLLEVTVPFVEFPAL